MNELKHRPGPWILSEFEVRHPITLELRKGCEIFCNKNNKVIAEIPDYCYHKEDVAQDKADAKLLTAAPILLDALQLALHALAHCAADKGYQSLQNKAAQAAASAIAKATQ